MASIFEIDRKGLAKLIRSRGLHRLIWELISNAFDEKVTAVKVFIEPTTTQRTYRFAVEDDSPDGFRDPTEAYTLFADSYKRANFSQRGRFNLGEKLVIACCDPVRIASTTGTLVFNGDERRHYPSQKREVGTLFEGYIRTTRKEIDTAIAEVKRVIPNRNVTYSVNHEVVTPPNVERTFSVSLPTVTINEAGELVRTSRVTEVRLYQRSTDQPATIYELGIPVLRLDPKDADPFHMDVRQKVPLTFQRENVTPAFLKALRTAVLDNAHDILTQEQAESRAVSAALEQAKPEAVTRVVTMRFGEKRAIFDPSDREANARLASEGYAIMPPGTFGRETWANIKNAGVAKPSGIIRPTPKPYSSNPNAPVRKGLDPAMKTARMELFEEYVRLLASRICGVTELRISWIDDAACQFSMACGIDDGVGKLDINVSVLGSGWFDAPFATRWEVDDILLDEFGHFRERNHLCEDYYRALREFGAKIGVLKLTEPELFKRFQ